MAPTGANFSALFNSHGALDMTQLTPTLAHSAGGTGKTTFTASVAVFLLSGLLSGVALADAILSMVAIPTKLLPNRQAGQMLRRRPVL